MHLLVFIAVYTNSVLFILFASDAIVISTFLPFQTSMLSLLLLFDTSLLSCFLAFDFIVVVLTVAERNAKVIKGKSLEFTYLSVPFSVLLSLVSTKNSLAVEKCWSGKICRANTILIEVMFLVQGRN